MIETDSFHGTDSHPHDGRRVLGSELQAGRKRNKAEPVCDPEEAFNPRTQGLLIYKAGVMITAPSSSDG